MKFKWDKIKQDAFDEIKRNVACDSLLPYPYFNEEFKIQKNSRDFQLGVFTRQRGKPFSSYSRKLTESQKRYTVTERELLSIVETIK